MTNQYHYQINFFRNAVLSRDFYNNEDNNEVSKALLGKYLVRLSPVIVGGMIVETESYPGKLDIASHHHHNKLTERTKTIFNPHKGLLYVYRIYGLHFCFGVTSGNNENQNVTLIRALEPVFGIEELKKRRKTEKLTEILNGPAKIAEALRINKNDDGNDLRKGDILICDFKQNLNFEIGMSRRIGISDRNDGYREKEWRFFIKGSKYLSR
jgi:DNA-3-methyladenine glycosylase